MGLLVQKYGGTSVGTPERIQAVAKRISEARARGHSLVVVVSAMGHTTDELIGLAHQVSKNPPHREMDMLLTVGERISMALLSMALAELGVPAVSFTGSQSGIITTASHRRARIKKILGDRVRTALADGQVAIVAGFQGVSENKEITTLGRGGSDTTAVAMAAALGAELCEIYTDVDGVYSADPRLVPTAHFWPEISHDVMIELSVRGAGVLHPRSIELAKEFNVPLIVRNSMSENAGTRVVQKSAMEDFKVAGVTSDSAKALVRIELARTSVIGAVWDRAQESRLSLVAPVFSENLVQFFAEKDSEAEWKKILTALSTDGFINNYSFDESWVPVSVVGTRFSQDGAALQEVFEVLAHCSISVRMGAASALAITVAVPSNRAEEAVQELHKKFFS